MDFAHVTATFSRPADATAYASGDIIANSGTAGLVVPITFNLPVRSDGRITGCRAVVTPASSTLVVTALDFDLLLFRPTTDIPFVAGGFPADNAALAIPAAAYRELVGIFVFVNGAWRNESGALTAGVTGYQAVNCATRNKYPFSIPSNTPRLIGVLQAKGAWTPGAVVNRFDFTLDIEA